MKKDNVKEKNKKSVLKRTINIIEYTFITVVILINAILIIQSVVNPRKSPDLFGKKSFIIVSGSMIPTINIGDVVILTENDNPNVYDIIGFRDNSSTVIVHRVIDKKEIDEQIMFQTKGDNNNVADIDLVKREDIEGKYQTKIPYIGNILMFLYNNFIIVVVLVVVFLIIKFFVTPQKNI